MDRAEVEAAARATLLLVARVARKTRSPADDLLVQMLQANESRLAEAAARLLEAPEQPPTDEQVTQALAAVGIRA